MQNDLFLKNLEQAFEGFQLKPSASVWQEVESRIQKEMKRRMIFWWFLPAMILMSTGAVFMLQRNEENLGTAIHTAEYRAETSSNNAKKVDNNHVSITEPISFMPSIVKTNKKVQRTKQNDGGNPFLKRSSESTDLFSSAHEEQNRIISPSNITPTDVNEFLTENIRERIRDTIIVVNCNSNSNQLSAENNEKIEKNKKERQLNFNAFYSFHGSGDLSGTNLEFGMEKKWGKRYGFYNNLGFTIHTGQEVGFTTNNNPLLINSTYNSLQTVTTGIQTAPTFYRYSKRGDLKIGAGLVARYQMTSYGNYTASSVGQGINQYSYTIYENDPNTLSIGYRISADLLVLEKKKNKLSFQLFFQNDTRGDVITGMGLSFQTTYKK